MPRRPANAHEALVQTLTERSMSSALIFLPDWDKEGKEGKEPCDLVYASRDSVLLIGCAQQQVRYEDYLDNAAVCKKKITHNLDPMSRTLRRWRTFGWPIKGENAFGPVALPYRPDLKVGVLSVIDCKEAIACRHHEQEASWSVDLCATVPDSAIKRMTELGGTAADIVSMVKMPPRVLTEAELLGTIDLYAEAAKKEAGLTDRERTGEDRQFAHVAKCLQESRNTEHRDVAHALADFPLEAYYRLVKGIKSAILACRQTGLTDARVVKLPPYYCVHVQTVPTLEPRFLFLARSERDRFGRATMAGLPWGPSLLVDADRCYIAAVSYPENPPPSFVADLLAAR